MDRISVLEKELADLRSSLHVKEKELNEMKAEYASQSQPSIQLAEPSFQNNTTNHVNMDVPYYGDRLPKWAIERYSRQILLPDIGVSGQEKLCNAKVLVVGAGGLGCPAAIYLAGAGIGEIGLVDYDTVDVSNIHRQILHGESDEHVNKVDSAANSLKNLNSRIKVTTYNMQLDSTNALDIVNKYDVILDCTDNVPTRYLLNDACALTKLPLISGSALKMEGQLTIYGYRGEKTDTSVGVIGPCYRCVFPTPPPPEAVGSCSANGVAGPVPGVIGTLQALEAIKLIVGKPQEKLLVERMLLFDGEDMTFRTVKLRGRNEQCAACSDAPTITRLLDYEVFCKAQAKEKKKQEIRLKTEKRKEEKEKRMTGQRYYGFRISNLTEEGRKWVQDVPKSERKIGPPCNSEYCAKGTARCCSEFDEEKRKEIFKYFWNELDWTGKKYYVRSLIDSVPPKRRRVKHKGDISRKGDSKLYHLNSNDHRQPVCRVMFLNTLGIKEAMVRCWLTNTDRPKKPKTPLKSLNVDSYIDELPKTVPKCQYCRNSGTFIKYLNIDSIKNQFQLYTQYKKDMKMKNVLPASRKTFAKVVTLKNLRIFKPKNENDVCDLVSQHNVLPSLGSYQNVKMEGSMNQNTTVSFYYNSEQW